MNAKSRCLLPVVKSRVSAIMISDKGKNIHENRVCLYLFYLLVRITVKLILDGLGKGKSALILIFGFGRRRRLGFRADPGVCPFNIVQERRELLNHKSQNFGVRCQ